MGTLPCCGWLRPSPSVTTCFQSASRNLATPWILAPSVGSLAGDTLAQINVRMFGAGGRVASLDTFPRASPHSQTGPIWSLQRMSPIEGALRHCHDSSSPAGYRQLPDALLASNNQKDSFISSNGLRDADWACVTTFLSSSLLPRPLWTVLTRGSFLAEQPSLFNGVLALLWSVSSLECSPSGVKAGGTQHDAFKGISISNCHLHGPHLCHHFCNLI